MQIGEGLILVNPAADAIYELAHSPSTQDENDGDDGKASIAYSYALSIGAECKDEDIASLNKAIIERWGSRPSGG